MPALEEQSLSWSALERKVLLFPANMSLVVILALGVMGSVICSNVQRGFHTSPGKHLTMSSPNAVEHAASSVVHCSVLCADDIDCVAAMFEHDSGTCSTWSCEAGQNSTLVDRLLYTAIMTNTVRLVNGSSADRGRLEVLHDGQWGTVCRDNFFNDDSSVVCRTLGYSSGVDLRNEEYGHGSGLVWLDDVNCTGSEAALEECGHPGWGVVDCIGEKDVGVQCSLT